MRALNILFGRSVLHENVYLRDIIIAAAAPIAAPQVASASELRLKMGTVTLDATCGRQGRRSLATVFSAKTGSTKEAAWTAGL